MVLEAVERVEKAEIFPPFPQLGDDYYDERRRATNPAEAVEKSVIDIV